MSEAAVGAAVAFYAWPSSDDAPPPEPVPLPAGLSRTVWTPSGRSVRPPGVGGGVWLVWWAFHHLRLFANREYGVVVVRDGDGRVVHRACLFPRSLRFPFMADGDLQLGDLWTDERWRGRGLAVSSLTWVVAVRRAPGRRFWYLAEPANVASVRVAEGAGFRCVGTGRREARWGLRALGAFRLTGP